MKKIRISNILLIFFLFFLFLQHHTFSGFGRSSRPDFSNDNLEAERQMIEAIESWRKQMRIKKMILLGHSMGAYLSGLYSLSYPERIQHLILADEWGYTDKYESPSMFLRFLSIIFFKLNPIGVMRALGPEWCEYNNKDVQNS